MSKKTLDETLGIFIEEAWVPEARNPFTELPSVKTLAKNAVESKKILGALASFVARESRTLGYSRSSMQTLRTRIFLLRLPTELKKETIESLNEIADAYSSCLENQTLTLEEIKDLRYQISAGISEAIVLRFLITSGRNQEDITPDARIYFPDTEKPSSRNIDFVWSLPNEKVAEIYECKNQPTRLVANYQTREATGNEAVWKKEQLYLMLKLRGILTKVSWDVGLGCITLRSRQAVMPGIERVTKPDELVIYCREDLGTKFPPQLPHQAANAT